MFPRVRTPIPCLYTYVSISTLGCRPFNTVYSPFHSIVNISIDVMLISRFATHCEVVYGACFLINHSEWGEEPQMNIKLRPPLTIIRIYNPSPRSLIRYYISIYTYVSIYIFLSSSVEQKTFCANNPSVLDVCDLIFFCIKNLLTKDAWAYIFNIRFFR